MRSLKNGPPLPTGKALEQARVANKPYLSCLAEALDTVTWVWPNDGKDAEHISWVLQTTWDTCSFERTKATADIIKGLHDNGGYSSPEQEANAAERYRSGVASALYLVRFMKMGKSQALNSL